MDLALSTSAGTIRLRSIEWYVQHNNRLWSVIIAWDTEMQNASAWETASRNFAVQNPGDEDLSDTAYDLGKAFIESQAAGMIAGMGAPIDVPPPAWWSGICNDNNFFADMGFHSTPLGASWHGVTACGPLNSMHLVHFYSGAWGELEFQCVELVMRFLHLEWGIAPWPGNGNTIKNSPPAAVTFYPNDGSHGIVTGDILTEDASPQNSAGHTVVVTNTSGLDGSGTGSISIMEQNASSGGQRSLTVQNGVVQPDAWSWGQTIQGWLHVTGNQEDGNLDAAFTPGTGADGRVNAIGLRSSGKILIAGDFTKYQWQNRQSNHTLEQRRHARYRLFSQPGRGDGGRQPACGQPGDVFGWEDADRRTFRQL